MVAQRYLVCQRSVLDGTLSLIDNGGEKAAWHSDERWMRKKWKRSWKGTGMTEIGWAGLNLAIYDDIIPSLWLPYHGVAARSMRRGRARPELPLLREAYQISHEMSTGSLTIPS